MEPATKQDLKDFLKEFRESIKEAIAEAFGNSKPALEHATTPAASPLLPTDAPASPTTTVDVVPVLAASAASAQPLDIDATGVVPPTPTTSSTECPSRDATASTSVFTLGTTPTSATATIDVTPVLVASVVTKDFTTPSRLLQAAAPALIHELRVLRPAPWPSFKCHSRAADTTKPLPWLSYMWRIGPVQKDSCPQSEIKALVSNMSMVCGNHSSSHSYISGNILLSPSGIWCLRDLFLSPMCCWPDIQYVQQTNAVLEAPLCPERHNIRICWRDVAPSEPALGLALGALTQTMCSTEGSEVRANSMVLVYKSQEHWNFYGHHLLEYDTPVCTIPRPDKMKGTMQIMNMAAQWKIFRQAEFQGSGCFAKQCGSEQYGTQRQSWRPLDQATSNAKQLGQECYSQTVMQETLCLGTFPTHADYLIYMGFINIALMGLEVIHSKQFNYKTQCLQSYSCYVLQPWEGTEYLVHCNASYEFYLEKFALVRKLDRSGSTNSVVSVIASLVHISNTCSLGDILVLTWRSQGLSLEQLQGETPSHDILVLTWLGSSTSYRSCVYFPLPPAKPLDDQDKCTFHWVKIQHMILVSLYFVSRSLFPSAAPFELYDTSLTMEMIRHIIFINWIFCAWDKICVVMEVDPMPSTAAWKKCGCRHLPGAYNLWLDYIFAQRISQNWAWRLYLNELRLLAYLGTADSRPASLCISTVLVDDPVRRWVIHICAILRAGGDQCKCQWSAQCFIGKWVEETGRSQNSESMDIVLLHCYAWGLLIADFLQVSIGSCLNGYSRMCGFVLLQWEIAWTLGSASGTQSRQPFLPPTVRSAASIWKQEGTQGGMCDMASDAFLDQAQVRHGCYIDHAYYYFPPGHNYYLDTFLKQVPSGYDYYVNNARFFDLVQVYRDYYRGDSCMIKDLQAPWDPGEFLATAWGQAVFQEGRGVSGLITTSPAIARHEQGPAHLPA